MLSTKALKTLDDIEILNWFYDREYPWRDEVWKVSNANSLQGLVDYIKKNHGVVSKIVIEKEERRKKK